MQRRGVHVVFIGALEIIALKVIIVLVRIAGGNAVHPVAQHSGNICTGRVRHIIPGRLVREHHRLVIMRLIDDIRVVDKVPHVVIVVSGPAGYAGRGVLPGAHALRKDYVVAVRPAYLVGAALHQRLALRHGLLYRPDIRDHGLVHDTVADYRRLVRVPPCDLAPEGNEPLLIFGVGPQRRALPLGLVPSLGVVHVQHQTYAVFLRPGYALVNVVKALLLVGIRLVIVLKPAVIQQEPHRVESQILHLPEAVLIMMEPHFGKRAAPHIVAESHAVKRGLFPVRRDYIPAHGVVESALHRNAVRQRCHHRDRAKNR